MKTRIASHKFIVLLLLLICTIISQAQKVKIINSGDLYSGYGLATSSELESVRGKVSAYELDKILKYSEEGSWPSGITTLDAREKVRDKINDYVAFKVCEFGNKDILVIPVTDNRHMPYEMRPIDHDIYFIIGKTGVNESAATTYETPSPAKPGSRKFTGGTPVSIKATGGLYSTFKIAEQTPEIIRSVRAQVGDEWDNIIYYSVETNWPSAINNFTSRDLVREKMNNYKAYKIAEFDGKYVLRISHDDNLHMSDNMRPDNVMYFIINTENIVLSGSGAIPVVPFSGTPTAGTPATMKETGGLFSSYNLSTENADVKELIRSQVGSEFDKIARYSKEDQWPSGISTLEARDLVREKMKNYKAFMIAEFSGKYILRITKADNGFMPSNMQPADVIYFVIQKDNVELTGGSTGTYEKAPENNYNNNNNSGPKAPAPINNDRGKSPR